jgi:hypothetical protein
MIRKILILVISLAFLNSCAGAVFEKGLNYEKTPKYWFKYNDDTYNTIITNKKNGAHIGIAFGKVACGFYGLFGPLIFPIIPFWDNKNCDKVAISIWEHRIGIKNAHVNYNNKIYKPSEISGSYNVFPLPIESIKSITDTAILVVEKKDGEIFEIPFRYQHTFSFDLFPGR